ncbi:RNA polymerase sigma factor [Terriglobus roseus]|uniref:RNA polymerase sigma-70 factor, ECF subfamily n=1 Tax=Terriglobus roseus TaxID=392734 RepID=A0A1H4T9Q2_9BACT|nr:sigma-70 family RNA polymerase sigma factor [Terriglobus roseus]SEC52874.1 RNA polymerase sigma-70 factor, ECF subfamily [Terriglobus roseus]
MQTNPVGMTNGYRAPRTASAANDRADLLDAMVEHRNYLNRVAFSILRHAEDAEDAVQAAYLSAWTGWASFRQQSSLKTWLTTIVMNKALTEVRKRRQTCLSMDADPLLMADAEWQLSVGQVTPEQHVIREQSVRRLQERMARLPQPTRTIVMLRFGQDLSLEEVALSSGTTRSSVNWHLSRGCKALRKSVARRRMLI